MTTLAVPPDLYSLLIARVSRATGGPGAKSALARSLDVPRQRVSEWLRGDTSPNAAKTLELLAWVEAKEAEQKNAERAATRSARKTRTSKNKSNEKAKPDQSET